MNGNLKVHLQSLQIVDEKTLGVIFRFFYKSIMFYMFK